MKKLVIILLFVLTQFSLAQWERIPLGKIYGGEINTVLEIDNKIFVGTTNSGIFLSIDSTKTWIPKNNGLIKSKITTLLKFGNDIYTGTLGDGVFLSTNNGDNWIPKNDGLMNLNIHSFVIKGTVFFVGTNEGVFQSTDFGDSWIPRINGLNALIINTLVVDGDNIYLGSNKGVYKSIDSGITWSLDNIEFVNEGITSIVVKNGSVLASTDNGSYLYSANYGKTWIRYSSSSNITTINSLLLYDDYIFAATAEGVKVTAYNANSWTNKITGLKSNSNVKTLIRSGNKIYACINEGSLFVTSDMGDNWTQKCYGIKDNIVSSFAIYDNKIFAGIYGEGLYTSTDIGYTWEKFSADLTNLNITSLAVRNNEIYLGTAGGGVLSTTNSGKEWTSSVPKANIYSLAILGNNYVYAGSSYCLYMSTNSGASWMIKLTRDDGNPRWLTSILTQDDNIYAGTNGSVFKSSDYGYNWVKHTDLGIQPATALAMVGNYLYVGTMTAGLFLPGNKWRHFPPKYETSEASIDAIAAMDNYAFLGNDGGGIFYSTDWGDTWTQINSGLDNLDVHSLKIIGKYIFAGTGSYGIFRAKLSDFGIVDVKEEKPINDNPFTIQPNPANDQITISLSGINPMLQHGVGNESQITIYNSLGEKVISVGTGRDLSAQINISNLPKGMYFVRIGNNAAKFVKM